MAIRCDACGEAATRIESAYLHAYRAADDLDQAAASGLVDHPDACAAFFPLGALPGCLTGVGTAGAFPADDAAHAIDVARHQMPTQAVIGAQRLLHPG